MDYLIIGSIKIPVMIFFVMLSIFVFIFSFYFVYYKKLKTFVIFDISFLLLIIGLIVGRLFAIINDHVYYSSLNWNFIPLQDTAERVILQRSLPWEFIKIYDGNIILWGVFLGILAGGALIYNFSNKQKDMYQFMDSLVMSIIPFQIVLLVGTFISQSIYGTGSSLITTYVNSIGEYRTAFPMIEIGLIVFVFVLFFVLGYKIKNQGLLFSLYLIYQGIWGMFVLASVEGINNGFSGSIGWFHIVSLVLLIYGLATFVRVVLAKSKDRRMSDPQAQQNLQTTNTTNVIDQPVYSDIEIHQKQTFLKRLSSRLPWSPKK